MVIAKTSRITVVYIYRARYCSPWAAQRCLTIYSILVWGNSTINFAKHKSKIVKSLRNKIHSRPTACTLTSVQCMQSQDSYIP